MSITITTGSLNIGSNTHSTIINTGTTAGTSLTQAILYLKSTTVGNSIYTTLDNHGDEFKIFQIDDTASVSFIHKDALSTIYHLIQWDSRATLLMPRGSLTCAKSLGKFVQNSTVMLGHEMGHAVQYLTDPTGYKQMFADKIAGNNTNWKDIWEKNNVVNTEKPIAMQLDQGYRNQYS